MSTPSGIDTSAPGPVRERSLWDLAPCLDQPPRSEIHVWLLPLAGGMTAVRDCWSLLSDDERERALRFRFPRDRSRFVIARAALRRILAGYVGTAPERLSFQYGPQGKPGLPGVSLGFNLSHSDTLAACAIVSSARVGVDIERVRRTGEPMRMAEYFFSAEEREALARMADIERDRAFLECWTMREAYLKGMGAGLAGDLKDLAASVDQSGPATLVNRRAPDRLAGWTFSRLPLGRDYVGVLAVEGPPRTLRWRCEAVEVAR